MKWSAIRDSRAARKLFTIVAAVCLAVLVSVAYGMVDELTGVDSGNTGSAGAASVSGTDIGELLDKMKVAPESPMSGYSREKFSHWDSNRPEHGFGDEFAAYAKCTTREVMLLRDATGSVTLDPATCDLRIGSDGGWRDQYGFLDRKTGALKPYKWITDPTGVDAEHIVPLAEAWRSGAASRDDDIRRRIANDALNLAASDPSANRSKGDQDAANYLPPGNFRCGYIARYVQVKIKYGLTADPAEHTALRAASGECVRQGAFT